jgi:hypothetical protein
MSGWDVAYGASLAGCALAGWVFGYLYAKIRFTWRDHD